MNREELVQLTAEQISHDVDAHYLRSRAGHEERIRLYLEKFLEEAGLHRSEIFVAATKKEGLLVGNFYYPSAELAQSYIDAAWSDRADQLMPWHFRPAPATAAGDLAPEKLTVEEAQKC